MAMVESPIVAIVGNKGACKTLMMTYIAEREHFKNGRKIYSNYHLTHIPYERFTYEMLVDLPEYMMNGVILMDETQMGADAYDFLNKKTRSITTLATQLRKRKLDLYMTTQRFRFISKRLRDLTDYIYALKTYEDSIGEPIHGVARVELYDRNDIFNDIPIKSFVFDGRKWFGHYDTNEVIQ